MPESPFTDPPPTEEQLRGKHTRAPAMGARARTKRAVRLSHQSGGLVGQFDGCANTAPRTRWHSQRQCRPRGLRSPPRCHGFGVGTRPARMMDHGVWCALLPSPTRALPCALRREPRAPPINPFPCPIPGSGGDGGCAVWWWSAVVVCSCVSGMSERRSRASVGCCLWCSQPPLDHDYTSRLYKCLWCYYNKGGGYTRKPTQKVKF